MSPAPALFPFLLSLPVFTLLTALTYPEREGSDKLSSAVIGRLTDDTADRHRGDRQEKLLHIKQRSIRTWWYLPRVEFFLDMIQRPEMTLARLFRENNGLVLLRC